jgi:hypothetical protein
MIDMKRLLAVLPLLAAFWMLPAAAGETLACPDLATLVQINACPSEEELQYTYTGYCSDNAMAYGNKTDACVRYADYRQLKNLALWESKDGRFDGYVSCDLPAAQWQALKPTGINLASQGKVNRLICSYPQGINLTYRTRETCVIADAKACAADAAACSARCD